MKLELLLLALIIVACNNSKNNNSLPKNTIISDLSKPKMNDGIFKNKLIVILSKELEGKSNNINIQDYIQNGKSFIPVFTSIEKFNESTQGQVRNQKIEIEGVFLLSILHGNETLKVNPGLSEEVDFQSIDLIKKYNIEIEKNHAEIKKIKEN